MDSLTANVIKNSSTQYAERIAGMPSGLQGSAMIIRSKYSSGYSTTIIGTYDYYKAPSIWSRRNDDSDTPWIKILPVFEISSPTDFNTMTGVPFATSYYFISTGPNVSNSPITGTHRAFLEVMAWGTGYIIQRLSTSYGGANKIWQRAKEDTWTSWKEL